MSTPWEILGLDADAVGDLAQVKRAYAAALKRHRPDRDPEGFRRVREAYEYLTQASEMRIDQAVDERPFESASSLQTDSPTAMMELDPIPEPESTPGSTWDSRLQQALADDHPAGDVTPLLRVVTAWFADPDRELNHRCDVALVIRLALRAPEVALLVAEGISLREQLQIPELGFRLDLARHMINVPEGRRHGVAALVDAEEGASVPEGTIKVARQVFYALPKCMLGEVIRTRLSVADPEKNQAVQSDFATVHSQEMRRLQKRTHLPTFGLSEWWEDLSIAKRAFLALIVICLLLWLRTLGNPPVSYVPPIDEELRARVLEQIEAERIRRNGGGQSYGPEQPIPTVPERVRDMHGKNPRPRVLIRPEPVNEPASPEGFPELEPGVPIEVP